MFSLTKEQQEKLNEWMKTLPKAYTGAAGGRYTYSFTPTGLGDCLQVTDFITKQTIDLTEYGDW